MNGFEERLFIELGQIRATQLLHEHADEERHRDICRRLERVERTADDTGKHDLSEAQAKLAKLEDRENERGRYWVRYVVGSVVLLVMALGGGAIALILKGH